MLTSSPHELVDLLQAKTLVCRTGIWLAPPALLGNEANEAARLNIDAVDLRTPLLQSLPQGTRFLGLSSDKLLHVLDFICEQTKGTDCLLVYNLDFLLARLRQQERTQVWSQFYNAFPHRKHALLAIMPAGADHLLPFSATLKFWNSDRRLAATNIFDL